MCEANAYLVSGEKKELIMESVDIATPENDGIRLINIFGEQKFIRGIIDSLSLVDHKIYIKQVD